MNIEEAKQYIALYIEDELQGTELQQFRKVLHESSELQKEVAQMRAAWDMLDEVEEIEPDTAYMSRFWTRVATQESWWGRFLGNLKRGLAPRQLMPLAVTACILILVGVVSFQNYSATQSQLQAELAALNIEEREIIENLELVENLDIIENMEILEDLEILEEMEELETSGLFNRMKQV